jgi:hypothetical protein
MDSRLSYQASFVRNAELQRKATVHRLAQPAIAEKHRRSSLWGLFRRAYRHRKPVEVPVPVQAAQSLVKPH